MEVFLTHHPIGRKEVKVFPMMGQMFLITTRKDSTMSFGPIIELNNGNGLELTLRPFWNKDEVKICARGLSHFDVQEYLGLRSGLTEADEEKWFDKIRDQWGAVWAIQPKDSSIIGVTALSDNDPRLQDAVSGITIWDTSWWGKGVATLCHHTRTWYAANYLNLSFIFSRVITENTASWRALERVGYTIHSTRPFQGFKNGRYTRSHELIWVNPRKNIDISGQFEPEIEIKVKASMLRAEEALRKAQDFIVRIDR